MNSMDGESNESAYGKFGMFGKGRGMNCGGVEVIKHSTLRWSGHLERMEENEMTRIYKSGVVPVGVRGRPPIKWNNCWNT